MLMKRLFGLRGTFCLILTVAGLAMLSIACQPQATPTAPEDGLTPEPSSPTGTELPIEESPFSSMACNKVIIRNEDVGGEIDAALQWISDLIISKDVKATYAVIPAWISQNPETIDYLNNLDKNHFEMGTHGYAHLIPLEGLPYEEQFALIEQATDLMEEFFHVRPYTFLPPWYSDDLNTLRVCEALGYHTLASNRSYPESTVATEFVVSDFEWESGWEPVSHRSYAKFEQAFDDFYSHDESMSSNEYFVIILHPVTFYDESGQPRSELISDFERSIDYMKSKNVEFMTIEEAYQWYVDEPHIVVGKVYISAYFVDLTACQYGHQVKFCSPPEWQGNVIIRDISTRKEIQVAGGLVQFDGLKGHYYLIARSSS